MGELQGRPAHHAATGLCEAPVDWRPTLLASSKILTALPGAVEADYLGLGERLQDFYARTRHLSETSATVSSKMSGQNVANEISGLQYVLDQTGTMRDGSRQSVATLDSILEELCRTRANLSAFTNITRHLHSLCNMIKIETARLGSSAAGFSTLATDVSELVKRIEDKATVLSEQSDSLITLIRSSFNRVASLETQQKARIRTILDDAFRKLEEITRHQVLSSRVLQDLSQQWTTISDDIGRIVFSLQSHDSTRQQIEHVVHVLDCLVDEPPQDPDAECRLVLRACVLQRAQLENASNEAVDAGERIVESLRNLAATVKGISTKTRRAAGSDDHKSATFMGELEKGLVSIVGALKEYEDLNGSLYQTLEHVAEPVKKMSTFLREIAQIGTALRMVGLNACIHAAHVGDQGVALSVLAESIHRVAGETSENIGAVSSRLETVVALAGKIADLSEDQALEGGQNTSSTRERLEAMITELSEAVRDGAAALSEIEGEARTLSGDLGDTATGMQAHFRLEKGLENVLVQMDDMLYALESHTPDNPGTPIENSRVEQFLARYTMQSERAVHQSVMEQPRAGESDSDGLEDFLFQDDAPKAADDDLGDNVELF